MTFVLDTNILSDFFQGHAKIVGRFRVAVQQDRIVTTTLTWYEILLKGRFAAILAASDKSQLLLAQARLVADQQRLAAFEILQISAAAADHFDRLRLRKGIKKIGRADLLIACIALSEDATLVTRNTKDFAHIPGLKLENWAA